MCIGTNNEEEWVLGWGVPIQVRVLLCVCTGRAGVDQKRVEWRYDLVCRRWCFSLWSLLFFGKVRTLIFYPLITLFDEKRNT